MFFLKSTRILSMVPMLLASDINLQPNPSLTQSQVEIPFMDFFCGVSNIYKNRFPKEVQNDIEYLCRDMTEEEKKYNDYIFTLVLNETAKTESPLLKELSAVFSKVSEDLKTQFKNQAPYLEYIFGNSNVKPQNEVDPTIKFIAQNFDLPFENFVAVYSKFLHNGLLRKYSEDFKNLETIDIQRYFKNGIKFIIYKAQNTEFETLLDAIQFVNKQVLASVEALSINIPMISKSFAPFLNQ